VKSKTLVQNRTRNTAGGGGDATHARRSWRRFAAGVLALCAGAAVLAGGPSPATKDKSSTENGKTADTAVAADLAAERAARRFLAACATSDWETVRELWTAKLDDRVKQVLGGLEVISVGEAETNRLFPGARFVPYEIRFKGAARTKKQKLTMKPHPRTGSWMVDGGI
jgi:hypothetical protein